MPLATDIYLNLLGVGELLENAKTVIADKLGLNKRRTPNLAGKTAIITGGNAGVGYATAEALMRHGTNVVLACRSEERAQAAAARLAAAVAAPASNSTAGRKRGASGGGGKDAAAAPASSGAAGAGTSRAPATVAPAAHAGAGPAGSAGSVEVELLDLSSLASVHAFVRRWRASGRQLDLLICNAGIMCPPERLETADGFELQFQSNFLSHFCLVNALVRHHQQQRRQRQRGNTGRQAGKGCGNGGGNGSCGSGSGGSGSGGCGDASYRPLRVIMLSSMTHFGGNLSDLADVPYCKRQRRYNPFQAYCNSKLCTLLAAKHLDRLFARGAQQDASSSLSGGGGSSGTTTLPAAASAAPAAQQQQQRDAAVAVHPGLVDTYLARNYFKSDMPRMLRPVTDPFFDHFFCPYLLRSPAAAAETVLYAATAPAHEVGGQYCGTAPHVSRHSAAAGNPALAQRVWELGAHLCQLESDKLLS